jgi:hypothetical protein
VVATRSVDNFFTSEDLDTLPKRGADPDQIDPYHHDYLRQRFSLEFDRFGVVNPERCWKAVRDALRADLQEWRLTHPGPIIPHLSKRLRITATRYAEADQPTVRRNMNDHLEAHAVSSFEGPGVAQINGARARMDNVPLWISSRSAMSTTTTATRMTTTADTPEGSQEKTLRDIESSV